MTRQYGDPLSARWFPQGFARCGRTACKALLAHWITVGPHGRAPGSGDGLLPAALLLSGYVPPQGGGREPWRLSATAESAVRSGGLPRFLRGLADAVAEGRPIGFVAPTATRGTLSQPPYPFPGEPAGGIPTGAWRYWSAELPLALRCWRCNWVNLLPEAPPGTPALFNYNG